MGAIADETLRWDLSTLYTGPDDPGLEADLARARRGAERFRERYMGQLSTLTADELGTAIMTLEELKGVVLKLQTYAALLFWADTGNDVAKSLNDRVSSETSEIENETKFFEIELRSLTSEKRRSLIAAPELANYLYYLQRVEALAPYTLSEREERVLATKDRTGQAAWLQYFTEVTAGMRVTVPLPDGPKEMSAGEAKVLRNDADRRVREASTLAYLQAFADRSPVLNPVYNAMYEDHRQTCKLRGYSDPFAPTLVGEDLDRDVIDALMSAVESQYPLAHRYYRLKAKTLGISDFSFHDVYAPYEAGDRKVPFSEARRLVLSAFRSMSPEFAGMADRFFTGRFLDVPPAPGKQGGAFCARMIPGLHPYVLLNYNRQLGDVSTLAHELGHGVHYLLAGQKQTVFNYFPITPLAETASTFFEMLTLNRLLEAETDPAVRRQLMASRIEYAIFIIMLQILNTRWELRAHALRAEGQVPASEFCRLWLEEVARLYGPDVRLSELEAWRWMTVPHLIQFRFYCYSYAFGQLLVYALYRLFQEEGPAFVPKFKALLAAGGSAPATEVLGPLGMDIRDPAFWQKGMAVLEGMIDEFEASVAEG